MRYRVIREHDRRYPIRLMCRALVVSAAATTRGEHGRRVSDHDRHAPCSRRFACSTKNHGKPMAAPASGMLWLGRDIALANIASLGSCVGQGFGPRP